MQQTTNEHNIILLNINTLQPSFYRPIMQTTLQSTAGQGLDAYIFILLYCSAMKRDKNERYIRQAYSAHAQSVHKQAKTSPDRIGISVFDG